MIDAIDLCCGAGGWAVAARGLPIRFRAVADIAEDCLETWRINHAEEHPDCRRLRVDLSTDEGLAELMEHSAGVDLILGGIPCAEISPLRHGKRVSEEAMERWRRLLDNCLAIVDQIGPRWWALEDVIGIERELPLPLFHGAEVPYRRINAAEYGPQSRLRTFLGDFPHPQPGEPGKLADCLLDGPHQTVPGAEHLQPNPSNRHRVCARYARILDLERPCPTITSSFSNRGGRQKRSWMVEDVRGRRRMLSWQEAALVQGFPRDYLFAAALQRTSEMVGQAIPIQVGRAILEAIVGERGV